MLAASEIAFHSYLKLNEGQSSQEDKRPVDPRFMAYKVKKDDSAPKLKGDRQDGSSSRSGDVYTTRVYDAKTSDAGGFLRKLNCAAM